jgi:nitroimidazol reductase NimA-like FMN-containing flavoprotein (pyridoxamine 5'-phosphate oxidase superfamily)
MTSADNIYEELSAPECLELLGAHNFGRIAVVINGHPMVFPVNYALDGDVVVFRTNTGAKLSGAAMGRVAFEIDGVDEASRTGWSVVVQGVGNEITSALDHRSQQLRQLEVHSWAPGEHPCWVEIVTQQITGRRLQAGRLTTTAPSSPVRA